MFRFTRGVMSASLTKADVLSAYKVLGLSPGAPSSEVRDKYRQLARLSHPDINGGDDRKMKSINLAFETVQRSAAMGIDVSSAGAQKDGAPRNSYQEQAAKWQQRRGSMRGPEDPHAAWNQRSEFDWSAAVHDVSETERRDPNNHPGTFNRFFSWEEDTELFRQIKGGASVAQAARLMGKPLPVVQKRLNSAQFKQRMQKIMRRDGTVKSAHHKTMRSTGRHEAGAFDPDRGAPSDWDLGSTASFQAPYAEHTTAQTSRASGRFSPKTAPSFGASFKSRATSPRQDDGRYGPSGYADDRAQGQQRQRPFDPNQTSAESVTGSLGKAYNHFSRR